jgi:GT2 family glycosyltransferase
MVGISIIVTNYNGANLLRRFLPSVVKAAKAYAGETEIIVVDDCSTDDSIQVVEREFPGVRVVRKEKNEGFSHACNTGFKEAKHGIALLLNNDAGVKDDILAHLPAHFDDPKVFAVTAKALDWDGRLFLDGGKVGMFKAGAWKVHGNYDVDTSKLKGGERLISLHASGAFGAFRREAVLAMGGFDELMSPFNWEDTDLSYRAWKRGYIVLYEPKCIAYHHPSTTINLSFKAFRIRSISARNKLIFTWKNLSDPGMLASHFAFLLGRLLLNIFKLDFPFYAGFAAAVAKLPEILEKRAVEADNRKITDSELKEMLNNYYRNDYVVMKHTGSMEGGR